MPWLLRGRSRKTFLLIWAVLCVRGLVGSKWFTELAPKPCFGEAWLSHSISLHRWLIWVKFHRSDKKMISQLFSLNYVRSKSNTSKIRANISRFCRSRSGGFSTRPHFENFGGYTVKSSSTGHCHIYVYMCICMQHFWSVLVCVSGPFVLGQGPQSCYKYCSTPCGIVTTSPRVSD